MITYDNSSWIQVAVRITGSVWPNIWPMFLLWVIYVLACYKLTERLQFNLGTEGKSTLAATMSFLMIFRANQAYARYWQGRTCLSMFFSNLADFLMFSYIYAGSGVMMSSVFQDDIDDDVPVLSKENQAEADLDAERARKLRVDLGRLSVALAVAMKSHLRVCFDGYCFGEISKDTKWLLDWDRLRLRQLLKEDEFRRVDACFGLKDAAAAPGSDALHILVEQFRRNPEGPPADWPEVFEIDTQRTMRVHVVLIFLMREVLTINMRDLATSVKWGIKDRFVPVLSKLLAGAQKSFETVNQIVQNPIPLPYMNLCKTLLLVWFVTFPFMVDFKLGYFGGVVIPILVAFALLGIDAISTELENPFGDDVNDLDLLELIHSLENETVELMRLSNDPKGGAQFVWRRMPTWFSESSQRALKVQLAAAEFAAEEVVHSPPATPLASARSQARSQVGSNLSKSQSGSGSALRSSGALSQGSVH